MTLNEIEIAFKFLGLNSDMEITIRHKGRTYKVINVIPYAKMVKGSTEERVGLEIVEEKR